MGKPKHGAVVNGLRKVFAIGFAGTIFLFVACALSLIVFSLLELWHAVNPGEGLALRNSILESIGLATIAVVSLELAQTCA